MNAGDPSRNFVVLLGPEADPLEDFAARELARYLGLLSGLAATVEYTSAWRSTPAEIPVAVGRPGHHPMLAQLMPSGFDPSTLGPEGFVHGKANFGGSSAWFVSGTTAAGVLYGVYALLEEAGATFLISGDLLANPNPGFSLPDKYRRSEPAFERRGFLLPYPLNVQESIWGLEDYVRLIDQMAKLRLNYLNLNFTAADPTLEYSFRGERNLIGDINSWETGFMAPRSFFERGRTDSIEVGKERFVNRRYIAPPELQGVRSQEEAHRRLKSMFDAVFDHAKKRGVQIGFAMDPTEIPTNFARFMRRIDRVPAHRRIAGVHVDFTDPLFEEHTRAWLSALFKTYPEAGELFFWNAEGYLDYPQHRALIDRYRPQFEDARRVFEEHWMATSQYVNKKTSQDIIDADIVQMEATLRVIAIARQLRPDFTLGFGFLFRGYVLQSVDRIVDKAVPFIDFQSSGVTPISKGVYAEYFSGMGARKRYIIARMDDDGSMFGPPFYLRQFQRDGLFQKALGAGVQGFVAQVFRGRGSEHHIKFLSLGTWNPTLTPEEFYRSYAEAIFGPQAAPLMERAFHLLEDSEQSLGWRSLKSFHFSGGCSELEVLASELLAQDDPYDGPSDAHYLALRAKSRYLSIDSRVPAGQYLPGKVDLYRKSVSLIAQANSLILEARATVSAKGRPYLDYLANKTEAHAAHLEMVALAAEGLGAYADAFINHAGDEGRLSSALEGAEATLIKAQHKARETARIFAQWIDHPSDLGILFLANVYSIQKVDRLVELVHRVVTYHQGGRYWQGDSGL